ncbi:DMT family transporter [Psychrobacillus sp. Sa2BUA9]|uniref:DMT family transporter n=1 Tax=Psychrobacillus faecigallinarum TaxID=2762235 RepID=A0ABR8RCY6_9BACI|nr:DMT family transporter [Psychrobacillus faecigallinarum]MBD7945397.1 DMT family transporter [Psychrobacillus faecigallinarum]
MNKAAMLKMTLSMAIFGSIGFFTGKTGIPAIELVFVRCICATLFLGALWVITGQHKTEIWEKKEIVQILLCGIFLVLNWVFLFKAFEVTSITIAITIYNLAPIFVLLLGTLFLKERMTWNSLIAVLICFLGSMLIVGINTVQSISDFLGSGFVWALLSAFCYAMTMLLGKGVNQLSAYAMTFVQTSIGILILLPFLNFTLFQGLTTTNWLYIIGTGLIHTGFVYYLFFDSLRKLTTGVISALVFIDPVVAILLDTLILDFRPTFLQSLGILLIFGGIIYTLIKPNKQQGPEGIEA